MKTAAVDRILEIIAENSRGHKPGFNREDRLEDIFRDALDRAEMEEALREEFNIELPDDIAEAWNTVQDALDYLTPLLAE